MLEENARVALMIGETLRNQTIQMGLYEMEKLLNRCVYRSGWGIIWSKDWSKMHFFIFKVSRGSGGIWERAS